MAIEICGEDGLYLPTEGCECPDGGGPSIEKVLYSDLKAMRDAGELTPGQTYRIIDYEATTTQVDTRAVSHPFDILVTADSETTLNENARAMLRRNDNYYSASDSGSDLSAWRLKYTIDNDKTEYYWADPTNGKGVVFYMEDEHNNVAYYDFKQLQFRINKITSYDLFDGMEDAYGYNSNNETPGTITYGESVYAYTFSLLNTTTNEFSDASAKSKKSIYYDRYLFAHENYIAPATEYFYLGEAETPNAPYMLNHIVMIAPDNHLSELYGNTFDVESTYNVLLQAAGNTFGEGFAYNIGENVRFNNFGKSCRSNVLNSFEGNTAGQGLYQNAMQNILSNVFGNMCQNFNVRALQYNTFGNNVHGIATTGSYGNTNSCHNNVFGNEIFDVSIYSTINRSIFKNNIQHIAINKASSGFIQNYEILSGTSGTNDNPLTISAYTNRNYTTFAGLDSNGVLKQWVPADSVT